MAEIAGKNRRYPSDPADEERAEMAQGGGANLRLDDPLAALRARLAKNAST
jgi:hypothetical protein